MPKEQLCWTCQNACGNCNWSADLKPVKGWTATKINKHDSGRYVETYHIEECPLYIPDGGTSIKPRQSKGRKHLTIAEKKMIADLHNNGMRKKDIAKKLNVSYYTVKKYSHFFGKTKEI